MKVSEKAEEGRNVFAAWICERTVYECKIAAENQAVAVEYVYSFVIEFHDFILDEKGCGGKAVSVADFWRMYCNEKIRVLQWKYRLHDGRKFRGGFLCRNGNT